MTQAKLTKDSIIWPDLIIRQKKSGYRFSMDSVILARLINTKRNDSVLEIGSGTGIVLLLMSKFTKAKKMTGVEIQKDLHELSIKNFNANQIKQKIEFIRGDIRKKQNDIEERFDVILSNPPFYTVNSGRLNKQSEDTLARHEISLTLAELIKSSKRLLKPKGKLFFIHSAERFADIIFHLRQNKIEPKLCIPIYSNQNKNADLVWIMAMNNSRAGLKILSPIICYEKNGKKSKLLNSFYKRSKKTLASKYPELNLI